MSEATKIRLRERKSQPRKSWFRPAKTEKGKWLRFYCCLAAVAVVLFIAFFGKYFAPYDPLATDYAAKLSAPGGGHLFGTDNVGRDVLSRILYGAGNSFILTFIMIAIVSVLGHLLLQVLLELVLVSWDFAIDRLIRQASRQRQLSVSAS